MKRFIVLILFLGLLYANTQAQGKEYFNQKKHELRVSIGSPTDDYFMRYSNFGSGYYRRVYVYNLQYGYNYYSNYYNAYDLGLGSSMNSYEASKKYIGATKTAGVLGLSYFFHIPNSRFSVGGTLSFNKFNTNTHTLPNNDKTGNIAAYNYAFTPSVRFAWLRKSWFQLYSGAGASLNLYNRRADSRNYSQWDIVLQLTPVGFSVGKDLFVFGEGNVGGRTGAFVGGIGYRF
jgi:hypothetical protein